MTRLCEEVRVECLTQGLHIQVARLLSRIKRDGGVVDKNVELSEVLSTNRRAASCVVSSSMSRRRNECPVLLPGVAPLLLSPVLVPGPIKT